MAAYFVNNAPKCEPRRSAIHGIGLFAKVSIEAGEAFMSLEGGRVVPACRYFDSPLSLVADEWNALSEDELLVRPQRTYYYCINHHLKPNALVEIQHRRIVASAAIAADQEITLDYLREPLPRQYLEIHGAAYLSTARNPANLKLGTEAPCQGSTTAGDGAPRAS